MKLLNYTINAETGEYTLWILVDGKPCEALTHPSDIERHRMYAEGHGERLFEMPYTSGQLNHFCRRIRPEFEDVDESNDNVRQMIEVSAESLAAFALFRRHRSTDAWKDINALEEEFVQALDSIRTTRDKVLLLLETEPSMQKQMIPII